ncbi:MULTISPECIES: sensor histidine kinase [Nostocales]|uniref:CHASE2 domain-containing protein n=3 Tax=Nostocales TaxID=1161 RepID=A0A0C1QP01_9CYAN|nr:CHASE2 domain-containing protein [Tolypothrix bouteillei]KAF3889312.1 CHASE2 domain-containing protein [Tolypothrix bouteillei VB521301]
MQPGIWKLLKEKFTIWRLGGRLGLVVVLLVIIARLSGWLQFLEWGIFDTFLSWRPYESIDERILIVGINEADIESVGTYPIPDGEITEVIKKVQVDKPIAIGLDIARNVPVEPGNTELAEFAKRSKKLIGIEKILLPGRFSSIPNLPSEQVGFSDIIPDKDIKYRRILLGTPNPLDPDDYKFSFSLRLAEAYLSQKGIPLENGKLDRHAIRFANTELPRFLPNFGGYVGTDAGGVQVLLNFRNGKERFRTVSLHDIKTGNFQPEWIRDRIVMIGMTAISAPDLFSTSAVSGLQLHGQIYGVEFHAHAVSQIINAVLESRPLIKTWSEEWEYIWILGWGFITISLNLTIESPWRKLFAISVINIGLITISYYVLLVWGWWIPVAPILLILGINFVGFLSACYQYEQSLKAQIGIRQHTIEMAFTEIHNGPLQTLAALLRNVQNHDLSKEELLTDLKNLNLEIRDIGEYLTQQTLNLEESLRLGSGLKIDLKRPIHEIFYEVYSSTIERNLPYFQTLKAKVRSFEPLEEQFLTIERKRELCQFLEEALCNVGKHAKGVTRLSATGTKQQGWYSLKIKDNGLGIRSNYESKGTKDSKNLAKQLGGYFNRERATPKGTVCELTWPLAGSRSWISTMKFRLKAYFQRKLRFLTKTFQRSV